ncbi:MAG: anaerobic ribonucleoside triphosphate reductase [Thermoguttaceae bacterium]|nr:anaerobic ribonucleoside triphosphate reductase [Thermoguttaceae bacterium]
MIKTNFPTDHVDSINYIVKRDGRRAPFVPAKIAVAIQKAFIATGQSQSDDYIMELADGVTRQIADMGLVEPGVEDIQDCVEEALLENGHINTARKYIAYRAERTRVREINTRLMKTYEDITFKDAKTSDVKRENANVNGDTAMGQMLKYGSEGAKEFFHKFMLKPEHSRAHIEGDIHIHDLDFYSMTTTCCQIDLIRLFKGGFSTGHGVLREPNDIQSYAALACIAIQSNQNDQHGGQSIVNFDYGLAPGVAKTFRRCYRNNVVKGIQFLTRCHEEFLAEEIKAIHQELLDAGHVLRLSEHDEFMKAENAAILERLGKKIEENVKSARFEKLDADLISEIQTEACEQATKETDRATYQAMEALIHNLNTMHSRAGAQTPFSSINYGMDVSAEGRLVVKNVLLAHEAGLGAGETPIFPIHIFRVKEGINVEPGEPNYDLFKLACRVSSKRLFPNFAFQDAPFNLQYYKPGKPETEIAYMGCRTRVVGNVYDPEREITYSRGNLSFTSINLPRIAMNAHGNVSFFFEELQRKLDLCVDQLLERFRVQCSKKVKNFPFLMGQGVWLDSEKLGQEDVVGEVLKHGTLSVGFIGLAETLKALIGVHHGESEKAQNMGLDIVSFMRRYMDKKSQQMRLNFSLLATPAEGLSGRFVRLDRANFGVIEGVTDREYYTNSFHIPVYYNIPCWKKIQLEAPYHALTNAGHITYVELDGDTSQNLEAFEKIVHAMRKAGVGYGAINHPIDSDPECGFYGFINGEVCPKCGRKETPDSPFERVRRITGYLVGTLDRFNDAKRAEVRDRVQHGLGGSNCGACGSLESMDK